MSTPPIASSYLNQHRILPLFEGLTSLLVYSQPKDPRAFMVDALKKIKEKNAFPYRPQDLDFLFPALVAAPDEVATATKHSVDAAGPQREHAPVSKGPATGNDRSETQQAKPASRGKEEGSPSEQELAAAKIQATYRGHAVRKEIRGQSPSGSRESSKHEPQAETKTQPPANTNTDEDEAAAKIQAAYRGHAVRKEIKGQSQGGEKDIGSKGATPTDTSNAGPNVDEDEAAAKIQAAYRGHAVRKELKGQSQGDSAGNSKPTSQESKKRTPQEDEAAVKIQAAYRGHAVRKELKSGGSGRGEDSNDINIEEAEEGSGKPSDEEAATKIQSVYRGHRVRKEMQESGGERSGNLKPPTQQLLAPPGVDENLAATKIQAVYRGHNVRKTMPQGSFKAGVLMMDQQPEDAIAADVEAQAKDSDDAETNADLDQAAIRIQAMYRGHIVRKQMAGIPETTEDTGANAEESELQPNDEGEVIAVTENTPGIAVDDIENPEEAERAATRIQASYRGYRTRKELGKDKGDEHAD